MLKLSEIMELLEVSEEDAIKSIFNLVSPPPPPATRQNWSRQSTFGYSAPKSKDLWEKLVSADFRCTKCKSQMRVSFNHINSDATDHRLENLEVIFFACNRGASSKGTIDKNHHVKLAISAMELWKQNLEFPSSVEILRRAQVGQIGGATYLLKFLKKRLSNKT